MSKVPMRQTVSFASETLLAALPEGSAPQFDVTLSCAIPRNGQVTVTLGKVAASATVNALRLRNVLNSMQPLLAITELETLVFRFKSEEGDENPLFVSASCREGDASIAISGFEYDVKIGTVLEALAELGYGVVTGGMEKKPPCSRV